MFRHLCRKQIHYFEGFKSFRESVIRINKRIYSLSVKEAGSRQEIDKNILRSKYEDVSLPLVSLADYLYDKQEQHANLIGLVNAETGESFRHCEIRENCLKVASGLSRLGFGKGDKITMVIPNCPEFVFALMGAITIGAVPTTINFSYTADEIRFQVMNSESTGVICHGDKLPVVREACEGNPNIRHIIAIGSGVEGALSFRKLLKDDGKGIPNQIRINPEEDLAVIPYSSGTTGLPKGVMLSHFNIVSNVQQITTPNVCRFNTKNDEVKQDVLLGILPMYHIYGMSVNIFINLAIGIRIITLKEFEQNFFVNLIRKHRPTALPLVPPLIQFLENSALVKPDDLDSVENIMSGAAPLGPAVIDRFRKKFGNKTNFNEGFGMTESSPVTHLTPKEGSVLGSCGIAVPNTLTKLTNPTTGETINRSEGEGELCVKGPQIMKGYWKNEDATNRTIKDGWLHTGDIARIDENDCVFIVDRLKELIKVKGLQVAPAELEDLLRTHPNVKDVAVIGIPDEKAGEVPRAFVVRSESKGLTEDEVMKFVAKRTASHKHIKSVIFLDEIPKSPAGKILRKDLRKRS